jgi:hypothetical protein
MTTIQKLFACLLFGLVFLTYSCNNDEDDPVGCNYATEVQDEVDALTAAATAYGNDPTPANCQAYKNAAQNYLNELQDHVECAALSGQQAELQAAINATQDSVDAIQC